MCFNICVSFKASYKQAYSADVQINPDHLTFSFLNHSYPLRQNTAGLLIGTWKWFFLQWLLLVSPYHFILLWYDPWEGTWSPTLLWLVQHFHCPQFTICYLSGMKYGPGHGANFVYNISTALAVMCFNSLVDRYFKYLFINASCICFTIIQKTIICIKYEPTLNRVIRDRPPNITYKNIKLIESFCDEIKLVCTLRLWTLQYLYQILKS